MCVCVFDYSFQCFHHLLEIKDLHLILEIVKVEAQVFYYISGQLVLIFQKLSHFFLLRLD